MPYARDLAEYLEACERAGIEPLAATRAQVAGFVRELTSRPGRNGVNVVALDSGAGLANAALQQRLVPVRLFYDFLVGRAPGVQSGGPRPLYPGAPFWQRGPPGAGTADGQAAVDSR